MKLTILFAMILAGYSAFAEEKAKTPEPPQPKPGEKVVLPKPVQVKGGATIPAPAIAPTLSEAVAPPPPPPPKGTFNPDVPMVKLEVPKAPLSKTPEGGLGPAKDQKPPELKPSGDLKQSPTVYTYKDAKGNSKTVDSLEEVPKEFRDAARPSPRK